MKPNLKLVSFKSPLTGLSILLPEYDVEPYAALIAAEQAEYLPEGYMESSFVDTIVDHKWRLQRIGRMKPVLAARMKENDSPKYRQVMRDFERQEKHLNRYIKKNQQYLRKSKADRKAKSAAQPKVDLLAKYKESDFYHA